MKAPAREELVRRGRRLEYVTIGYNLLEAVVGIVAGLAAGSIALVGFGFDSLIEVTSGAALVWRLNADAEEDRRELIEAASLRIVGVCFLALALYVAYESVSSLAGGEEAETSVPGILLGVASLVVMPLLARAKRRVAGAIGSAALEADAKQTDFCFYLSAILVGGLTLNAWFGWWWADPVAGAVMAPLIAKEGLAAIRGQHCGCGDSCHG